MELIVALGMFLLVGSVLTFNYPELSNRSSVDSLVHEVALALRETQVYGSSVKETGQGTGVFPGYGVYFSTADLKAYDVFNDTNPVDAKYSGSGSGELRATTRINSGEGISNICGNLKRDGLSAGAPGSFCSSNGSLTGLHISFVRPNPDASITATGGVETALSDAEIAFTSKRGDITKTIVVYPTGQIEIE